MARDEVLEAMRARALKDAEWAKAYALLRCAEGLGYIGQQLMELGGVLGEIRHEMKETGGEVSIALGHLASMVGTIGDEEDHR